MRLDELSWSIADLNAPYDDDLLLDVRAACITVLVRGRNAWHSTWVRHFFKNSVLYTDVASAKQGAEQMRGPGNVFYVFDAPALLLSGRSTHAVLCDANAKDPFTSYSGIGATLHESAIGNFLTGVYPGISVRDAVRTFRHDSGEWVSPRPDEHSLRTGRVHEPTTVRGLTRTTFESLSSYAQGSDRLLGWRPEQQRYSASGSHVIEANWKSTLDDVRETTLSSVDTQSIVRYRHEVLGGIPRSVWDRAKSQAIREAHANYKDADSEMDRLYAQESDLVDMIDDAEVEVELAREARLVPMDTSAGVRQQRERYEAAMERLAELRREAEALEVRSAEATVRCRAAKEDLDRLTALPGAFRLLRSW